MKRIIVYKDESVGYSDDLQVICPYCEYAYQPESGEHSEHEREVTCHKCDREFIRFDEIHATHYTRKLPKSDTTQPSSVNREDQKPSGLSDDLATMYAQRTHNQRMGARPDESE